ncbi:hypothetical protein NHX12_030466 [Muraenolepis orangiensis]|uniref:Uncharacterized protein n=1 Tax=Muraenolepis orangiensis TaxID=630683 RepID=A0A9Q0EE05_9TELE|nr:hypothetical protein NHX12_030466 [Muraenolepis orangiensis]
MPGSLSNEDEGHDDMDFEDDMPGEDSVMVTVFGSPSPQGTGLVPHMPTVYPHAHSLPTCPQSTHMPTVYPHAHNLAASLRRIPYPEAGAAKLETYCAQ